MPTVFTILCSYQKEFNARPLTQPEKKWLGKRIAFNYDTTKIENGVSVDVRNTQDLPRAKSFEKEGEFSVVDYPDNFVPIIIKTIEDFYKMLSKRKGSTVKRKRSKIAF